MTHSIEDKIYNSYKKLDGDEISYAARAFLNTFAPPADSDDIVLGYTGDNLTSVVYKKGSTTLVTLSLTYTGARLDRVQKV